MKTSELLTPTQIVALKQLSAAHQVATDSGLFDAMMAEINDPDSINDVCDTVSNLVTNL